jgi:phosphoglycolate phosphatase
MTSYLNRKKLVIFDADGTLIDTFHAIEQTFLRHGMALGDRERFQKRRKLLKYLGGLRELPTNLRKQFGKQNRKALLATLTEIYRNEARLYPAIDLLLRTLLADPDIRVGLVTRNVSTEPEKTLGCLLQRHDIDIDDFDYLACLPLGEDKTAHLKHARECLAINPARTYACGDEHGDYLAAIGAGVYPFVVAYGFEDHDRLVKTFDVPCEVISTTPAGFIENLMHTLDLTPERRDAPVRYPSVSAWREVRF